MPAPAATTFTLPVEAVAAGAAVAALVTAGRLVRRLRAVDFGRMSGRDFEDWVAARLHKKGWRLARRGLGPDGGVDLEGRDPAGRRAVVQCKNTRGPVGAAVVREITGVRVHDEAEVSAVVASRGFTLPARSFAEHAGVLLIEAREL